MNSHPKLVREWMELAANDLRTAEREFAITVEPNYDAVSFHAQQAVEKLMKAALVHAGAVPPRTHDLLALDALLRAAAPAWNAEPGELARLSVAAVELRYPGNRATLVDANTAITIARKTCADLRAFLP